MVPGRARRRSLIQAAGAIALGALLPESDEAGRWIELARRARQAWKRDDVPHPARRPLLVEALAQLYAHQAEQPGGEA